MAVTEANLSLTDMAQAGLGITSVCPLPLILDGACGWGDPMHLHRTIGMAEAVGFAAIEIEDQTLLKRAPPPRRAGTPRPVFADGSQDRRAGGSPS
jgi:2-methylisocitrate lyase-like PEP mutase family enzyme